VVGPESSKAWVRNVIEMTVSISEGLKITSPTGDVEIFKPEDWLLDMDSTQVALPSGSQKLQGVPLWKVIEPLGVDDPQTLIRVETSQDSLSFSWQEIEGDNNLRIFTVIMDDGFEYALGAMSGEVYLYPLTAIEIN
jgi:hypothetical protein